MQPFYADKQTTVLNADAVAAAAWLAAAGVTVDCIVTSPPYYGQRDYGVEGQIGWEPDPADYVRRLVDVFTALRAVLKPTGSLWVNLGDTYWNGKGTQGGKDPKQLARRCGMRPQNRTRPGPWTRPKQLLLLPHRFAIAMQEQGWLLRNDNVWVKDNPTPDPVRDRCAVSHEYVFHFVRERHYWFDKASVARPTGTGTMMPPYDTWQVPTARGPKEHRASYSEQLVRIPILATCPEGGTVLDPFAGTGTTLAFALRHGRKAIGVDICPDYCQQMQTNLEAP